MPILNTAALHRALTPVIGLPLSRIGRAANMLWLQFGEMRTVSTRSGGEKAVGQWAIHVQCPWRLCREGGIVLACRDFYNTPQGEALDEWDVPGGNRFDAVAGELSSGFMTSPPVVMSLTLDDVGGFSLHGTDGYRLDVFPADSGKATEHWRIFQPGESRGHFVFQEEEAMD